MPEPSEPAKKALASGALRKQRGTQKTRKQKRASPFGSAQGKQGPPLLRLGSSVRQHEGPKAAGVAALLARPHMRKPSGAVDCREHPR